MFSKWIKSILNSINPIVIRIRRIFLGASSETVGAGEEEEEKKEWQKEEEKQYNHHFMSLSNLDLKGYLLLFLGGICLLLLFFPSKKNSGLMPGTGLPTTRKEKTSNMVTGASKDTRWQVMKEYAGQQEKELERILSTVEGIGRVKVMLTVASTEEKKTLLKEKDEQEDHREQNREGQSRTQKRSLTESEPVLVRKGESQAPYVVEVASPKIEGVLVVAEGAGTGTVDAEIIAAVEALFPVEAHKIKVMKGSSQSGSNFK